MVDKYLWLEEIQGEKALEWAKEKSASSTDRLKAHPLFTEIEKKALAFYGTKDKIPYVSIEGEHVYNLWTDDDHIQGIYRRTKIKEYLKTSPVWETLLDLDLLSKTENIKWVFQGFELNENETRALVFISPGGSDANIMREFDLLKKEFLPDGFSLPESKGSADWIDDNTIRVERIFDEDSKTNSGYARTVREWKRGTSLASAQVIFEVNKSDMSSYSKKVRTINSTFLFLGRQIDFYNIEEKVFQNDKWIDLTLPKMVEDFGIVANKYIVILKEDWKEFKTGDIITYDLITHQSKKIFTPAANESIYSLKRTHNGFYVIIDEDVKGTLYKYKLDGNDCWSKVKIDLPKNGSLDFLSADYKSAHFFIGFSSFNQPLTYYYGEEDKIITVAKVSPSFFNHQDIIVEQKFVPSLDGTNIPYFLAYKKGIKFDGSNPTILYGYGGFEISLKATFNNGIGASWLDRGGVYVLSNIRGGGEYGPSWHQCALKENRHRSYEDFFAIAEDLIKNKITSKEHLGAMGGSNGGLLMGVCYVQRPDLFKSINCGVPLLDMYRYHKLLAGASWIAEYGDPDDENDGRYIKSISPYQKIKEKENYPVIFLNTSTKDDRVHPGHARKFVAKLLEYGHDVYYYENMLGGHGGASNFKESAINHALGMCFFWSTLK